nr:hypothetical protein [Chloroflexaceae bacterium]
NGQRLDWLDTSGTLNSATPDDIVGTVASSATAEPLPPTTYRIVFFLNNAPVDERSVTIQEP